MDKKPIYTKRKVDTKMLDLLILREIVAVVGPRQAGKTA
jgi:predicted AAA+ superfamily ATPase